MSTLLSELTGIGTIASYKYGVESYDQNKLGLGPLMIQISGIGNENNWMGPLPVTVVRPMEFSTNIPCVYPWAMQWSSTLDWVFLADNAAAAAT